MNAALYFHDTYAARQPETAAPRMTPGEAYSRLPLALHSELGRGKLRDKLPASWAQAHALWHDRSNPRGNRKVAHNTWLRRLPAEVDGDMPDYAVRYHETDVVAFHADGTATLTDGGWATPTTRARINGCGFYVWQAGHVQFLGLHGPAFGRTGPDGDRMEFGGSLPERVRLK
jgi:hypothetical protein